VFQYICCASSFQGGKVVNVQNYVFYFECDIAKVFQFRPTYSSYDSVKKSQKRTSKESEQMSNLD